MGIRIDGLLVDCEWRMEVEGSRDYLNKTRWLPASRRVEAKPYPAIRHAEVSYH